MKNWNNMVGLKRPSKIEHYQKHFSMYRLLIIITMILSVCALQCNQLLAAMAETYSTAPTEDCSLSVTCTQCAARSPCSWSLRRQICAASFEIRESSHLVVHELSSCPRYSLVSRFMARGDASYAYAVRLNATAADFTTFIAQSGAIECQVAGVLRPGRMSGDTIECEALPANSLLREGDVNVHSACITFAGGVALRLDNVSDSYFAVQVSEQPECGRDSWNERCVTCTRNDAAGTDYLVRCSSRNKCTGLFEYRDTRRSRPGDDDDNNNALSCEPDVRVRSVEPVSAPWTGNTRLLVTVSDRGVLAEKAAISVSVGGSECANPTINDRALARNDTIITCTLPRANANRPIAEAATIRVLYALNRTLMLEGVPFRYDYPEISGVERVERYGDDGGWAGKHRATELIVVGTLLNASDQARVRVGAGNVACHVTCRTHHRIECSVAIENATAANGLLTVDFDNGDLKVYAVLNPWAVYVGEPSLNPGQSFRAMAAGGSVLPVHGQRLRHVSRATFYATGSDGVRRHGNCHVVNNTYASCVAPPLDTMTPSDFGLLIDFAGRRTIQLPATESSYSVYPNPVYNDFETDTASGTVTVNGGGLGGVAYLKRDVTVRLSNVDGGGVCDVLAVYPDRIVCASSLSSVALDRVRVIVVTICDRLELMVRKKAVRKRGEWSSAIFRWTVLIASTAVLVGLAVLICGLKVVAKRRLRASDYRIPHASDDGSDPMMVPLPGPD